MIRIQMMLLLLVCVSTSFASIHDANGFAENGVLSAGEYGSLVRVRDDSVLTVDGGGATDIDLYDISHLDVISTSFPLIDYQSGIYDITISDNSTLTFSGGVTHVIEVRKNATTLINGGQINYLESLQKPSLGKTIIIDCMPNSWSWIGEKDAYIGITGKWKNGNDFSIAFLNDTIADTFPDTWTHVQVTPEPTSMLMLGFGWLFVKKRLAQIYNPKIKLDAILRQ